MRLPTPCVTPEPLARERGADSGGAGAALFQIVGFLAYGVLGRVGAPLYALLNTLGLLVDAVVFDRRFSLNHVAVAVLPPDEAVHRK